MFDFVRRMVAAHSEATDSAEGDAVLEYALVATGLAMVVGYGLFIGGVGDGIDRNTHFAETAIRDAEPAVMASAPQVDDEIVTGSIGGPRSDARSALGAVIGTGASFGVATDHLGRLMMFDRDGNVRDVIDPKLAGTITPGDGSSTE